MEIFQGPLFLNLMQHPGDQCKKIPLIYHLMYRFCRLFQGFFSISLLINQEKKQRADIPIMKQKRLRAITLQGATEKSSILLSPYWKK